MRQLRKYETLNDPADDWAYLAPARARHGSGAGRVLLTIFAALLLLSAFALL